MDVPLSLVLIACVFTTYTKGSNSLQLRNSPATASPGQPYTLMCSSSGSGGRSRGWYWRNDIVFRTRYVSDTQCAVDVSNNDLYNHLSGRVSVTCSLNQQNVTLRILTSTDNGSVWWCVDVRSQESNRLTIYVVNLTTVSPTTTIAATTATTATTTTAATTANFDISTSTSLQEGDSNSLQLTSSPATASPDQPYTLMCSSRASRAVAWYWRNDIIFRTSYVSDKQFVFSIVNDNHYRHLSGRVNVTCSYSQHNVTLRILTSIDNGSVWWCVDTARSQESNRLTIQCPLCKDAPNVVYIAVGAAVGGIVVGCVITIIVVIVWMRRRTTSTEDDASAPNIYTSPSHYEDMGHQYGKVEMQYVNTVGGIGSGSPDSVNTEDQAGNAAYYNTAGQHQHRDEDANTGHTTYYNTACDADN